MNPRKEGNTGNASRKCADRIREQNPREVLLLLSGNRWLSEVRLHPGPENTFHKHHTGHPEQAGLSENGMRFGQPGYLENAGKREAFSGYGIIWD